MTQSSSQGDSHGSAGHANHGKKSSDTAWLVGSIAVTVPSVLYLLHSSPAKKPDHHGSGHRSSTSALEHEGGASSGAETAKSQMDPTPESVSEAAENARDWANERLGETGEQAGEAPEPATERSKNRAHDGDKGSEEVAGRPNQDGEKDSGDSQGREGTHTPKEPIDEKKKVEKTGGDSKSSETLSNLNMKQNPSKTPSQVDPPATGMKGAGSTDKTSGKQGPSNSDTSHAVRTCPQLEVMCLY
ncbi:hypothetical protein HOY80DRAFT_897512 [Tuber brumale]|nr:hypothetical protein HOY80DRAFT_897512 [Tuber brumale]